MAGRHNIGPRSSVNLLMLWLKNQSNRESIGHISLIQNFISCHSSVCSLLQSRGFTLYNRFQVTNRGSISMTPLAGTSVISHLLAGDLHIFEAFVDNQANFNFRSQRNVSWVSGRKSATHYYDVLGLSPNATQSQIKSAYYKMSKLHHPDVTQSPKSHSLFTEINEAYETLGNLRKRRMYDRGVFSPRDIRADTVVDNEAMDYTQAYRRSPVFERGGRPPPPTGRSKIYNFDEFYRQHYNDMRERRSSEFKEYVRYKEMKDKESINKAEEVPSLVLVTLYVIIALFGSLIFLNNNYDVDRLHKSQKRHNSIGSGSLK